MPWFLLSPVIAAILWLPLRSGGTDQFPLVIVQAATFAALALTALRQQVKLPGSRVFWGALGMTLGAALVSTIFSKDLDASVPAFLGWLWLAAVAVLVASHSQGPAGPLLGSALVVAVGIQAFWGFFAWWGGGDPSDTQSGTFYSPNQYAGFLLLLAPLLIAPALTVKPRREAAAWGGLAAFVCLGVILSGSRGGMAALAIGAAATLVLAAMTSAKKAFIRLLLLIGSTVVIGLLLTSPLVLNDRSVGPAGGGPLENILLKGSPSPSLDMRLRWVEGAVRIGVRHPITGSGLGTYGDMLMQVQEPSWFWSRYAHNHYAEMFAEGGVFLALGVIAIPAAVLFGGFGFVRRSKSPIDASTIGIIGGLLGGSAHLVIDHDWSFPAYAVAFMTLASLAMIGSQRNPSPPKMRRPAVMVVGAISIALLIATVSRGSALLYMNRSGGEFVGPTVTRLAPYSAQAHSRHARQMTELGNINGASVAIEKAIALDELDPQLRWRAAEIYLKGGSLGQSELSHLEAIRISPNAPSSYGLAAEFFLNTGRPKEAIEVLDQGLRRLSEHPMRQRFEGSVEALMRLREEAVSQLEDGSD